MENNVSVLMPVLNESTIIETKMKHLLELSEICDSIRIVCVEGNFGQTGIKVSSNNLSSDGTTEILEKYDNNFPNVFHIKAGLCKNRADLQNRGIEFIHKHLQDTTILYTPGVDEFVKLSDFKKVISHFENTNDWLLYTQLGNIVSKGHMRLNEPNKNAPPFPFNKDRMIRSGEYHERFYRYRPDLYYLGTAHAISDITNKRPLFYHPDYYFSRSIDDSIIIYHYKYVRGLPELILKEMRYLEEDADMEPYSQESFKLAKKRLRSILDHDDSDTINISGKEPEIVVNSDWYKEMSLDFDITLEDVLEYV